MDTYVKNNRIGVTYTKIIHKSAEVLIFSWNGIDCEFCKKIDETWGSLGFEFSDDPMADE